MKNNLLEQFPEWICTTPEGGIKILSQILYKNLKNDLKLKISDKGNYFLYRNGLYALVSERELKSIIKSHIPVELRKPKDWNTVWLEFCSDEPNVIENDFDSNENLVPFKNGVLELDSGKLVEYNEKMIAMFRKQGKVVPRYKLVYVYDTVTQEFVGSSNMHLHYSASKYAGATPKTLGAKKK